MSLPSVLIRISTGEVIKYAAYPREDMQPVVGLDPDLEWLIRYEPFPAPPYDGRYYSLVITDNVTTNTHPVYTWLRTYERTYALSKRPATEIQSFAEAAENSANQQLISIEDRLKYTTLAVASLIRQIQGNTPTPEEEVVRTKYLNYGTKVWQNDSNLQAKIAEILLGNEPDLDDGWQTTE